jgi:hypothetical protein
MATTSVGGISVDTRDFKKFASALRRADPVMTRSLRTKLRMAGSIVAVEAAANVAPYSKTIPPTIKVRVNSLVVTVTAKGELAGLFEFGNAGAGGGGSFRHPLFGNTDYWYAQKMHPFMYKALEAKADVVEEMVGVALDEALDVAVDF